MAMLQSSHPYDDVLAYAGIGIGDIVDEVNAELRKLVDQLNREKDEEEQRNRPPTVHFPHLSAEQNESTRLILQGLPTPSIDNTERMILEAIVFKRGTLPTNPHCSHQLPIERVEKIGAMGIIAGTVYRDIWLVMRMDKGRKDAAGPHAGFSSFHTDPTGRFTADLKLREEKGIEDAITRRLRNLLPQLEKIEGDQNQF